MIIRYACLETALGDTPETVAKALLKKQSAAIKHPFVKAESQDGLGRVPILAAPVKNLNFSRPFQRSMELFIKSFEKMIKTLSVEIENQQLDWHRLLLYIILPPLNSKRSRHFDPEAISHCLFTLFPMLYGCTLKFVHDDLNTMEQIIHIVDDLDSTQWQGVIVGGVDSLINSETYQEMIDQKNIRKMGFLEAEMPGEGAALIFLQKNKTSPTSSNLSTATSSTPSIPSTPSSTIPLLQIHSVLKSASHNCKKESSANAELFNNTDLIISNRYEDQKSQLVWYEKTKCPPIPEIRLRRWLGYLGAAELPMLLAIGYGSFIPQIISPEKVLIFLQEMTFQFQIYKIEQFN